MKKTLMMTLAAGALAVTTFSGAASAHSYGYGHKVYKPYVYTYSYKPAYTYYSYKPCKWVFDHYHHTKKWVCYW